jgi:ABC-2 type transport system ATP-binding protein
MNEIILQTRSITKKYSGNAAVDSVNMAIRKGDIYGLIGRNGAGKTTLTRIITSLTSADNGEVELFGETTAAGLNEARRRIGCVIEMPALYPNLTAVQNLEYYRILRVGEGK